LFLKPKYFYTNLGFANTILAIQDPKQYKIRRMQVNPFFTPQAMGQYEGIVFDEARKMISRLHQALKHDEFVDITGEVGRLSVSLELSIYSTSTFGA
jgi:cytochrome P450